MHDAPEPPALDPVAGATDAWALGSPGERPRFDPRLLVRLAREHGTPLYVYDLDHVVGRLARDDGAMLEGVSVDAHSCPHFTIEMETGTGKTYVYLRSMLELHRRYGFTKFIVVVPSVAILEGVKKAFDDDGSLAEHAFRQATPRKPLEVVAFEAAGIRHLLGRDAGVGPARQQQGLLRLEALDDVRRV